MKEARNEWKTHRLLNGTGTRGDSDLDGYAAFEHQGEPCVKLI